MFCFTSFHTKPLTHCPLFAILAHWGDNFIKQVVVFTLGALSWVDHWFVDSPVHMLPCSQRVPWHVPHCACVIYGPSTLPAPGTASRECLGKILWMECGGRTGGGFWGALPWLCLSLTPLRCRQTSRRSLFISSEEESGFFSNSDAAVSWGGHRGLWGCPG